MLPSLPNDVISEILSWVPVKPACRFQCVSRGWRSLITSRAFLAVHKSRAEPLLVSVTTTLVPKASSVLRLMDIDANVVRVIKKQGLCTIYYCFAGPVCLRFDDYHVSVVDLATGNLARTSAELHELRHDLTVGCALPSHTFKVVCFGTNYEPCKVLALEDGAKWRPVQPPPTPSLVTIACDHGSPVTVGGVLHILCKDDAAPQVDEDYVLRFDLEREEWKACVKGPRSGKELQDCKFLVNLDDALCIVQRTSQALCLIWVMTDSAKGTWDKLYTIPMNRTFNSLRPLTLMRDGRKLLFYALDRLTETATLQEYDPLAGTCTILTKFKSNLLGNWGICVLHLECFVSPLSISPPSMLSQLISCK
ncbi:hypothetical protein ACQ4PT_011034 [Festuca glaucescens]